jgi:hypothetical protein
MYNILYKCYLESCSELGKYYQLFIQYLTNIIFNVLLVRYMFKKGI